MKLQSITKFIIHYIPKIFFTVFVGGGPLPRAAAEFASYPIMINESLKFPVLRYPPDCFILDN